MYSLTYKTRCHIFPLEYLGLRWTRLDNNAFDEFCNQTVITTSIDTDCGAEIDKDPEIVCDCCTGCQNSTGDIVKQVGQICQRKASFLLLDGSRNATCNDCVPDSVLVDNDATDVSPTTGAYAAVCTETCESCNKDGTVCAVNAGFSQVVDSDGDVIYQNVTFEYSRGPIEDTLVVENFIEGFSDEECRVSINGEYCRTCTWQICPNNGFLSYGVRCDNLNGIGNYNPCDAGNVDVATAGPLAVFAFQDPFLLEGCSPLLPN